MLKFSGDQCWANHRFFKSNSNLFTEITNQITIICNFNKSNQIKAFDSLFINDQCLANHRFFKSNQYKSFYRNCKSNQITILFISSNQIRDFWCFVQIKSNQILRGNGLICNRQNTNWSLPSIRDMICCIFKLTINCNIIQLWSYKMNYLGKIIYYIYVQKNVWLNWFVQISNHQCFPIKSNCRLIKSCQFKSNVLILESWQIKSIHKSLIRHW